MQQAEFHDRKKYANRAFATLAIRIGDLFPGAIVT